ncbi:hypothetical protein COU57_00645 [Candidatus Pacearchaeota archaeon CG10_big_fil_rev_8_21_14_0_10_32_14]|nr:MAG: hypothetical protein COU57_00645 [Candidatus Pacearchaeota archaeon CG10_big_fil_rev_8_21_14_0_10_32_14]
MIKDILEILIENKLNEQIKGIYLYGSYARVDYDSESDRDILVITKSVNKSLKHKNYEITLVSEANFAKNLSNLYYASMLKEIKTLLNEELIEKYLSKKSTLNIQKVLKEIESVIKINKETVELLKNKNKNIPDGVVYSIVLRLRELYTLKCLKLNRLYNRNDFIKITGEKIYSSYSRIKKDGKELSQISPDEIIDLLDLSEKWLKELKGSKKGLKV